MAAASADTDVTPAIDVTPVIEDAPSAVPAADAADSVASTLNENVDPNARERSTTNRGNPEEGGTGAEHGGAGTADEPLREEPQQTPAQ